MISTSSPFNECHLFTEFERKKYPEQRESSMNRQLRKALEAIVGKANLLRTLPERICYSYDASGHNFLPEAVALPQNTEQVAAILALAQEHRFPVIPRGAGSGTTGGALALAGGLVLALSRMNRIVEIDAANMVAVVEPGVITGELQAAVKKYGLMYPPDPASLHFCTLGGNAAECAGGPSAVKYGVTRDYILGLEAVLPSGEIIQTGVRTAKGVVGYDLTRLLVGSEGTLAVFTRLILRLIPLAEEKKTFLLSFSSLTQATQLVARLLAAGLLPCTLEYMDKTALSVVRDRLARPPAADTAALLLVEFDGREAELTQQSQSFIRLVEQESGCTLRQAEGTAERQELWAARRSISPALFSLRPHKIAEDVVVPRTKIPDLVHFLEDMAQELGLLILSFGHAGDGNIHVNILLDKENTAEHQRAMQAKERLFRFVLDLGGTLSGEHGIGLTKAAFLPLEVEANSLKLMRRLKQLFDPYNILNPGKIFPE